MAKDRDKEKEPKSHAVDDKPNERFEGGGGMNTGVALIGFILCFLSGAGLMWGYDTHKMKAGGGITADTASAGGTTWSDSESPVPVTSNDPMWGSRTAPVTIVVFSDFQCPFCSRVEPTLEQVRTTYGPDKVRMVWKNAPLPFHDKAKPAAEAAQGVFALKGNDAFWKFHDTAFKNQQSLSAESYEKWAAASGVDAAKFKAGIAAHTWAKKVDEDQEIGKKAGVNGTPAFFVNGVSISGAQPFDKFKEVIDKELGKAQAKLASGTPKDKLYVAMSTDNKKNAPAAPKEEEEGEKEDTTSVFKVPVGSAPILGNPNALVTVVTFSDFQCPYCKRVGDTEKKVRETYGDKVRWVWKNEPLPFHPRAEPAAELALEAREEKGEKGFWEAHDKLFESQPKLDDADLEKVAEGMHLNVDKVKDAIKNHKFKKMIDADAELADDVQASGTPHFFINGRRLVGAQPFEKFQKIIDEEVTKASALVAKGTAPSAVYDALIKDGKGAPEPEKKNVAISPNAPAKGNLSSKIVIQEFSDFQCPFCGRVEPTVQEIMKNYGDKVKFMWRDMPLPMHSDAPLAAQAAREAYKQKGPDAFWKMHDKLYASQSKPDGLKREALDGYAKELGLDMDKWKSALDHQTHKAEVDADQKAGNDAGISGTPAFIINGYFINGAQPYPKFKKLIDRAIADSNK